jgi:putative nucleotidyltransferase with HDIG domain
MISHLAGIISNNPFDALSVTGQHSLLILAILATGSALTGGLPLLSARFSEFSLYRVFIFSIFLLMPEDPSMYFAFGSILAGAMIRIVVSESEFWRYITSGTAVVILLRFGPVLYNTLDPELHGRLLFLVLLPVLVLFETIISLLLSGKGSRKGRLSVAVIVSYIASLPLSVMTVIMIVQEDIFGAVLATAGLIGFSLIGRSINRKHQWNTRRIEEIGSQDRLATRLMDSSSYGEFLDILEKNLFREPDSTVHALSKSSGSYDWVIWSVDEQSGLKASAISGVTPAKGQFSEYFRAGDTSGIALGLSENRDLILLLSGPEKANLQSLPPSLLENLVVLLAHTWEAVGHAVRSERSFLAAAVTLARLADSKDDYTHGHSLRVASLSCSIGRHLNLSAESIQTLQVAAILHDIGKLAIPVSILTKRGLLTRKEREIVEAHPAEGARIVSGLSGFEKVARIIKSHHERLDGNGYPDGLSDGEIPFMARIVAVADTFDAITSDRSYHSVSGRESALEVIREEKGSKFDSRIVSALETILSNESKSIV